MEKIATVDRSKLSTARMADIGAHLFEAATRRKQTTNPWLKNWWTTVKASMGAQSQQR